MRIGELSRRTGTSRRLLRYYEEQGLIVSGRTANGYRTYDESIVDQVGHIRGLLDAGLPTRIIGQILPCLDEPGNHQCSAPPTTDMIASLEREHDLLTSRIDDLTRHRDAMAGYLAQVRERQATTGAGSGAPPAPAAERDEIKG